MSTIVDRLFRCGVGPEEPWYALRVERAGFARCASARERALVVAGRAAWLAGFVPLGSSLETDGWTAEAYDCKEAAEAWRAEAGSGRVS